MIMRKKIALFSIMTVAIVIASFAALGPTLFSKLTVHAAASALPYHATADGPYIVRGNMIVGADGTQYIFHGVARDGLEYNCSGEGPLDQQHLAFMGPSLSGPGGHYWGANTVRLPLSEGFWFHGAPGYPCSATQYQALVKQTVNTLTALKLNVMLDLQWTDAGGQSGQGGGAWSLADSDSITFWQQVASTFKGYSNVLFEVFNEPHPNSWSCWQAGCSISETGYSNDCGCSKAVHYNGVGMQALVNAVRSTGASNLVIVGGNNWGFDLSQLPNYPISGTNIVYDTHPYPYADKMPNTWDAAFGNLSARYPIMSAESGEYDCGTSFVSQLYSYLDAHQMGWVAWAWATNGNVCAYPELVTDYQGTPSNAMGQYVYQRLHSYV
jgi:endoglucanase